MENVKLLRNEGLVQFIKFGIVGVANTAVDWVVFYVLVNTLMGDLRPGAKAISFVVAVLNSYLWNTIWTFKKEYKETVGKTGNGSAVFMKFFVVSLVGWGINVLVYKYALDNFNFTIGGKDLIPLVLASGAAIVWNFFANKLWTYKK